MRCKSIYALKETDGPDGSDFYGFFGDFEENKGRGQLGIEEATQYQARDLEIYNEDTEEWEEPQMRYDRFKGNLARQISLSIGF